MGQHRLIPQAALPTLERRSFLFFSAAAILGSCFSKANAQITTPANSELAEQLRTLLVSDSAEMNAFALNVYSTCVLGKIRPPAAPLEHAWIVPGGGYFAQWLWDTMFVVDLLAVLPGQEQTIRGVFQNYWDFQNRWNAEKPAEQHGMIANFIAPFDAPAVRNGKEWRTFPAYSQAPLLAWGMERVYRRNGDKQLLCDGIKPLEQFHEWYWRERDVANVGMVGVGSYSGDAQHARYETYDREVDLDQLRMTPHPGRPLGSNNGAWYGDILIPANTSYLLLSELCLERMALVLGDHAMASRRRKRYSKGAAAVRNHMWSQEHGCYLALRRDTLEPIAVPTVGGFMPLMAGVPSVAQAACIASALATPAWSTPLPIPTVARSDPRFSSSEFWRGDVWPAPNYQVASGLAACGQHESARRIADLTLGNAIKQGISERYDSFSGAPLGVAGLGMSATTLTLALDGLTSDRYAMHVRSEEAR